MSDVGLILNFFVLLFFYGCAVETGWGIADSLCCVRRELFLRLWDSAVPLLKFVGLDERARFIEQFAFELYSSLVCFAASVSG